MMLFSITGSAFVRAQYIAPLGPPNPIGEERGRNALRPYGIEGRLDA